MFAIKSKLYRKILLQLALTVQQMRHHPRINRAVWLVLIRQYSMILLKSNVNVRPITNIWQKIQLKAGSAKLVK